MFKKLFLLPPAIWLLGWVSFFNDTAGELVYSIFPLYVTSVLMAGPRALGLIEGIAESTGSVLKLFSGYFSDRSRIIKPWVVTGYSIAAVSRPLLSFVSSWPFALFLRVGDRLGKGLRTSPRDALIALSVSSDQRGIAFGFHRAMDSLGSVLGPLAAVWMISRGMPYREILLWVMVPGVLTVILALIVREPVRESIASPPSFSFRLEGFSSSFKAYLAVLALFTLGNASNMFLLLRAREIGVSENQVPLLWGIVSLSAALFSTPFSYLSDLIGRSRLIYFGWTIYGLFYLTLGFFQFSQNWIWPLFAGYGLFMAATEGVEKALVADLVPSASLGTAFGWFNLVAGLMLFPSSLLFGWLWQAGTSALAFSVAAGFAFLSVVLLKLKVFK